MALAQAGRDDSWVAVDPGVELPGMWSVHPQQADWDQATTRLAAAGWRRPALVAAWLDLETERIEAALEHPGSPPPAVSDWDVKRLAIADAPAFVLRERAADPAVVAAQTTLLLGPRPTGAGARVIWSAGLDAGPDTDQPASCAAVLVRRIRTQGPGSGTPTEMLIDDAEALGFQDVALELALVRADHNCPIRPDRLVAWLAARGRTGQAIRWCERWMESARQQGDNDNILQSLGWAGDLHLKTGDSERAQRYFEEGKAHHERALYWLTALVRAEPGRVDRLEQLSTTYNKLGDTYLASGESAPARMCYE